MAAVIEVQRMGGAYIEAAGEADKPAAAVADLVAKLVRHLVAHFGIDASVVAAAFEADDG